LGRPAVLGDAPAEGGGEEELPWARRRTGKESA